MGPNRRAQERERAAAAEEAKRAEAERKAIANAQKIVAIWNARQAGGRELWFYPTIGAAIAAGYPWLTYSCPGCRMFSSIDPRKLDRHPGASISSLVPSLSCRWCTPNAPFAKLEGADGGATLMKRRRRVLIKDAALAIIIALALFGAWKLIAWLAGVGVTP
jgi:hypothetical protein